MGDEIRQSRFERPDFTRFQENLRRETECLGVRLQSASSAPEAKCVGFELEFCLLDENRLPAPQNIALLETLHSERLAPELSRFNLEWISEPHELRPDLLSRLRTELEEAWQQAESDAERLHLRLLMIGILPTLPETKLDLDTMSPLLRYRMLNEQLMLQREGRPLHLDIRGHEQLVSQHSDVMLEAAATSLQVHLQVPPAQILRFYNAALIASAPLVALAANSPFLFGKDLWAETRIPLFEQAVGWDSRRVSFGRDYVRGSLLECFWENLEKYPVLLPVTFEENSEGLPHLRLHNGTIWRWNRPIAAPDAAGDLHLRIEHRVMAAGPTISDVIANIAACLGLVHALAEHPVAPELQLSFAEAQNNFYQAARLGLEAEVTWNAKKVGLRELWLRELLPRVGESLKRLEIDASDLAFYLDEVLFGRLKSGQSGAVWQRAFVGRYGKDFPALTAAYGERQRRGSPVHEWTL
ncbi:MAG TPA: glutamate--cysteine ligase [Deltaproteobacteria bacterium]|nr:glutamate--cysteine ligase [Deltaproteobacteria bacterium]